MQIEAIGSEKKSQGTENSQQAAEVRRMAQSMAAERLASAQAAANGGQTVTDKGEIQSDAVQLSNKALSEVSTRNSASSMNRRDDLLSSLMSKLDNEILNPDSEFNKQNEKKKKAEGASGSDQKKQKNGKQEHEWTPDTVEGQIHPGRDVIGKMRVTQESQDSGGDKKGGVGGVGQAGKSKSNAKGGVPNYGKAAEGQSNQGKTGDSKDPDKESKEASAAKNLEKQGLKSEKLEQAANEKKNATSKEEEQAGSAGASKVEEFDVRTKATGANQSLTVTPAKKIKPGEPLRTFRKLDDKPMLKYATLHKQDHKTHKEAAKELEKNARAAGESDDAIQRALQLLKDRTKPDQ